LIPDPKEMSKLSLARKQVEAEKRIEVNEFRLTVQEQLLIQVDSIKNLYSVYLFILEHVKEPENILNCKWQQESDHDCLFNGEGLSE